MQQANENGIAHIVIRELSESDRVILGHVKRVTNGLAFPVDCSHCKDAGTENPIINSVTELGGIDLNTNLPICQGCAEAEAAEAEYIHW